MRNYRHFARGVLAPAFAFCLAGCSHLKPMPPLPVETSAAPGEHTQLDTLFASHEAGHPKQSGFRLLHDGPEAFVTRLQSARLAGRTIDVQTYIWHGDTTGLCLVRELLRAADRGVKVRLLVDDMDARARNAGFAALDAHENVFVRMFNPFASRKGKLRMLSEGVRSFGRINHRMHNKTWIADNRIAVVGGRNLGDEYFGASEEVNFVDLDFAMIGPVVREASTSFDKYWNSIAAYPMSSLDSRSVNPGALARLRKRLDELIDPAAVERYTATVRASETVKRLMAGDWPMEWSEHYKFVSDDPLKATLEKQDPQRSQVLPAIVSEFDAMQSDAAIVSPYFVPGDGGTARLVGSARSGKRVRILTNSLLANDVAAVHGAYSRYRLPLLEGGVSLWELKPLLGTEKKSSLFGSSGASLHTKAFVLDGRTLFVGSFNLDPRSTWLNCEQGVLVENTTLAQQFETIFMDQSSGQHAWLVTRGDNGRLSWNDGNESLDSEPHAPVSKRFQAWLARFLHLDAQL